MTYGRQTWGRAAFGGGTRPAGARAPGGIAVPGFDTVFYWSTTLSTAPYGRAAYGGRSSSYYPTAGIAAIPDPAGAVTNLMLWWAFADAVAVTRIEADGTRVPVRDAEAVALPRSRSRRNRSSNPKARDSLSGYTAGTNTSISRITGVSVVIDDDNTVTTAVRGTATAGGGIAIGMPLDAASPLTEQYQWRVRTSALATTLGLSIDWYDRDSQLLATQTYLVSGGTATAAAAGFTTAQVSVASRPGSSVLGVVSYIATGLSAGDTLDVTARLRETTIAGPYFDGDSPYAAWMGAAGLSFSQQGVAVYVRDFEAPLDTPVRYEITSSAAPGYAATSEAVTLLAQLGQGVGVREVLMTHPGLAHTIRVWVEKEPSSISKAMEQGVFEIEGRRFPVVITGEQRGSARGSLTFVAETFDERDRLERFLDDGSPLLLRCPADWGHPPNWWLSFGDLDIQHWTHHARKQVRRLEVPFIEVERPSVATRPLAA
ncbi:hypothetical protein GCM10023201_40880 [Actinomycetospora corticicola]|uniref:Uncharacterized protein n=1 Tax=Actinomycetospora corticicola TaxID=663602 RepID=A0A7Y9DWI2_9PSEU|nr:hypothetical protein [Actinomycetospora corticicola]NYD36828.1 hypothetical protein [Actinomycetospora corticicola]